MANDTRTPGADGAGLDILVIDDDVDDAVTLRDALELAGHRVAVAHDGAAGIAQARSLRPAVVLCDVGLPRMSGLEVARTIRRDPALARVKLVALTGYTRPEDAAAAREAGFDHHVGKPARIPDLDRALRALAAERDPAARGAGEAVPARTPPPRGLSDEVAARNRSLETFLSRAFHDLRAPLRHVEGYCDALLEDCGGGLGDKGRRYVSELRLARARVQALGEDLLTLWRVVHAAPKVEAVDLAGLAREVCAALARRDPERRVELAIQDGVTATGDPTLLRVVLEQLLGNAWKYTARVPVAHVAFGATATSAGPAYFVRDDGTGFDPALAGALFEPFERLHSQTQFEGTGLGLHIVKRAVERYGGRVWAESAPGRGTTVQFTLG